MSDDDSFDAVSLAADATSDPVEDLADQQASGGGALEAAPSSSGAPDLLGRLFDGSLPGPSTEKLKGEYGFGRNLTMVLRGTLRVAGTGDGIPPVFEIFGGALLELRGRAQQRAGQETERESDDDYPEVDVATGGGV
ncbi:hypothetical protein [Halomarina oriensis]|uniref:Uncharacterized protein n=1 Tax=Halomarina oriensis TaxID=671145 RepID=A0A6B0GQ67_9EURY|nr:hypothetical protein [Halomarina oriensis]MWG36944.1 hypothetical protein [Halomarina oriensis]